MPLRNLQRLLLVVLIASVHALRVIVVLLTVYQALETVVFLNHFLDLADFIQIIRQLSASFVVECAENIAQFLVKISGLLLEVGDDTNGLFTLRGRGILRPEFELSAKHSY